MTMPLLVWNQSINNYITETCSMKFPENELIYIFQSNTQWRFLKLWIQRNSACSQASHWQAKATKFKCTAGQKSCPWPCIWTVSGISSQVQHFNVEQCSTIASSTLWCLNHYFILKIPCQTHNPEIF